MSKLSRISPKLRSTCPTSWPNPTVPVSPPAQRCGVKVKRQLGASSGTATGTRLSWAPIDTACKQPSNAAAKVRPLDNPAPNRELHQLGARAQRELLHDPVLVEGDSARRDPEGGCRFLHGTAAGKEPQDFTPPRRERLGIGHVAH